MILYSVGFYSLQGKYGHVFLHLVPLWQVIAFSNHALLRWAAGVHLCIEFSIFLELLEYTTSSVLGVFTSIFQIDWTVVEAKACVYDSRQA